MKMALPQSAKGVDFVALTQPFGANDVLVLIVLEFSTDRNKVIENFVRS